MSPQSVEGRPVGGRRPLISREFIEAHRRRLLAAAAVGVTDDFGINEISVAMICDGARSSRATFYELFADRQACLRHAQREGVELLFGETVKRLGADGEWGARVDAARRGLFAGARSDPALARFALIHARALPSLGETPDLGMGIAALASLLARRGPAGVQEEYVACLHVGLLSLRLLSGEDDSLHGLEDELAWTLELLPDPGTKAA